MNLKLTILTLSERMKWKNWPTWLKGFFLLWPSIGPAYLFINKTPVQLGGEAEFSTIIANVEYLNYFIVVFLGFWSINFILLGLTWIIGSLISDTYRSYIREISKKPVVKEEKNVPNEYKILIKKYPVLVKKGEHLGISSRSKTIKKRYPILKKKKTNRNVTK